MVQIYNFVHKSISKMILNDFYRDFLVEGHLYKTKVEILRIVATRLAIKGKILSKQVLPIINSTIKNKQRLALSSYKISLDNLKTN